MQTRLGHGRGGVAAGIVALAILVTGTGRAWADGPSASPASIEASQPGGVSSSPARSRTSKDEARAAARMGSEAFKEARWADAIEALEHAESLVHAPTHLLMIARARAARGELTNALRIYAEVAAESPAASEPAAFARARDDARREKAELEAKLAERDSATVAPAPAPPPKVDPPPRAVAPVAPRAARPAPVGSRSAEEPWQASLRPAAIGALALGVASTALGAGLYTYSSTKRGEVDAIAGSCAAGCSQDQTQRVATLERSASDLRDAGVVGLVAGGILVSGGLVLLVTSAGGREVEASRPGVRAFVGPMSAGATGTF